MVLTVRIMLGAFTIVVVVVVLMLVLAVRIKDRAATIVISVNFRSVIYIFFLVTLARANFLDYTVVFMITALDL